MIAWLGLGSGHDLLLYMASVLVLNATPGVDLLLTVTRTLQGGPRAGVAAALGINAGCLVHTLAAAFGLAALLAVSATAFTFLKWAGAAYLLWLAWGMLRSALQRPPSGTDAHAAAALVGPQPERRSAWQDFRVGFITNVLNPKVALFFLAFIPQFIAPGTPNKTLAFVALGLVFIAQSAPFLLVLVWATHGLKRQFSHRVPGRGGLRWIQALGGAVFIALAWRLAAAAPSRT